MYWFFGVSNKCVAPLELVLAVGLMLIMLRFLYWRSYIRVILLGSNLIMLPLNLIGFLVVSYSYSLAINLALYNLLCLVSANFLSARNRVLSVCKPTIPKGLLLYRRYGL